MFSCYLGLAGVQAAPARADQLHGDEISRFRPKLGFRRGSVTHTFGIFRYNNGVKHLFNRQILQSGDAVSGHQRALDNYVGVCSAGLIIPAAWASYERMTLQRQVVR